VQQFARFGFICAPWILFAYRFGALVLLGPGNFLMQRRGGMKRPVWIAEKFTRHDYEIGFAVADDLIGLHRLGDHADSAGWNIRVASNGIRERDLIASAERNFRVRRAAAAGAID
jgi:hypothetical protein